MNRFIEQFDVWGLVTLAILLIGSFFISMFFAESWGWNDTTIAWRFIGGLMLLGTGAVRLTQKRQRQQREQQALACYERAMSYGLDEVNKDIAEQAIAELTEAIRLAPHFAGAYFWRGVFRIYASEFSKALFDMTTALDMGYEDDDIDMQRCLDIARSRASADRQSIHR